MMDHKKVLFFKLIFGAKLAPQKFLDGLPKLGSDSSYASIPFEDDFVDRPFQYFSNYKHVNMVEIYFNLLLHMIMNGKSLHRYL